MLTTRCERVLGDQQCRGPAGWQVQSACPHPIVPGVAIHLVDELLCRAHAQAVLDRSRKCPECGQRSWMQSIAELPTPEATS